MKAHWISTESSGFTLIDLLMVVLLMSLLSALVPAVLLPSLEQARVERTRSQLLEIRDALVGNPELQARGVRTDFGYLGDMGGLPDSSQLSRLCEYSGAPAYAMDSNARFGHGWNGPYLKGSSCTSQLKDAWSRDFVLTNSALTGTTTLTSYGADGLAGGTGENADIVLQITEDLKQFTVYGLIGYDDGSSFTSPASVWVQSLDGSGSLNSSECLPVTDGAFQCSSVSMGKRSVSVFIPSGSPGAGNTPSVGPLTITPDGPHVTIPPAYLKVPGGS